jgi:hypothetical protein
VFDISHYLKKAQIAVEQVQNMSIQPINTSLEFQGWLLVLGFWQFLEV